MKHLRLLVIISLVLLPALSQAADTGYGYPFTTPFKATILQTPPDLKPELPKDIPSKRIALEVIPGLKIPEVFFYNNGVRLTYVFQKEKAPLVFLISGTGGDDSAPRMQTMMKALYQAGYHVVILPSPTHPNFVEAASHSHVPGDPTEDAADLYWVMENFWNKFKDDIEVSDFYLSGFSLGATQSAFVAKLDEERMTFKFKKVLMINPAVNLYTSVSQIEGLLDKIPGGRPNIGRFFNGMLAKVAEFYHRGEFVAFNEEFMFKLAQSGTITPDEAGGLIGVAFRLASAGMIFSADVMNGGGYVVPKNKQLTSTDSLTDYFRVCGHLSFLDYFNEYFFPYFQKKRPGLTKEALIDSMGLKGIEGYLKSNNKFGVMTNENDFILTAADLDYLRQLFGDRAKIYPVGGHGGNFEYKDNMAYALGFFK